MSDDASEYGRLLAERDRLIADGADPSELDMPLRPMTGPTAPQTAVEATELERRRIAGIVARLPRMLTEADDYSWVPLGDVLVAVLSPDRAEAAWPEGQPPITSDALLRAIRAESSAETERLRQAARRYVTAERALDVNRHADNWMDCAIERGEAREVLEALLAPADAAGGRRFDHDGMWRHHHDSETAEAIWWTNAVTVRLHPATPHGDRLHRLAQQSPRIDHRVARTVCGIPFAWGAWLGRRGPLPRCHGCFPSPAEVAA